MQIFEFPVFRLDCDTIFQSYFIVDFISELCFISNRKEKSEKEPGNSKFRSYSFQQHSHLDVEFPLSSGVETQRHKWEQLPQVQVQ